jgi:glycosyltransferase involved in cell wall biosynthesis
MLRHTTVVSGKAAVMRVIIDARLILPRMTGIGRYLCGLAQGLRELPGDDRFELWLQPGLPANNPVWQFGSGSLSLREVSIPHMSLRQQWALPLELLRHRPDLVHYPHFDLPWAVPGPVVATIYDLKYIASPAFFPRLGRVKRLMMLTMMLLTVQKAQRIITLSESTRRNIVGYLHAAPEKVAVVPGGVDDHYFHSPPTGALREVRSRYELDAPFLLFVGERRPHKNIVGLLRAFQVFRLSGHDVHHLVIVGQRYADYQEPEQVTEALSLTKNVHFLDYVPEADLPLLYRSADAFVILSFYEGFGLPVLEAMACGTPVVAAETTSLPEVAGKAGLLVDPRNLEAVALALGQVIPGGEQRDICIARGLVRASEFRWEHCAPKVAALYREVIT